MRLSYPIGTCARVMNARIAPDLQAIVTHVVFDSRKIQSGQGALFFALSGIHRTGMQFIRDAADKGVRMFVIPEDAAVPEVHEPMIFLRVPDPLKALQQLALHHRSQFDYPVVGITGSVGKTTFKEWAFHLLSPSKRVIRSPKSFNSQIGVAVSLLELTPDADIALIEAGISEPGEMEALEQMIRPDIGVFTSFGTAHRQHFRNKEQQLEEKLLLFRNCRETLVASTIVLDKEQLEKIHGTPVPAYSFTGRRFSKAYEPLAGLAAGLCRLLGIPEEQLQEQLLSLPQLALRMETFGGIHGNTIINDTYNLDTDALTEALHYQRNLSGDGHRTVIIGLSENTRQQQPELENLIRTFSPEKVYFIPPGESIPWEIIHNSYVLVKGSRDRTFEKEVNRGRELKHRTVVEINLSAIRHNVQYFRKRLKPETAILCMVKASSYGSGAERVAAFLQQEGADYFGVAFADEGVALREAGITCPIMVMNADPEHAATIIAHNLEPAIYSFTQLDTFVTALIHHGSGSYPVHLKFDTGMHRLGFSPDQKERVLAAVAAQPEIRVQGIYSHLADADNTAHPDFTEQQLTIFAGICGYFRERLEYPFKAHILNSEGSLYYPEAQYDMIRLGIVLYGYPSADRLKAEMQPAVQWKSAVSQVKKVSAGDFIGYGLTYQAEKEMTIAVVPVGYADGFRRSLSNGKGAVYIHGNRCPVVGRVCMDMIMVDVSGIPVAENDLVEIIGPHQDMSAFARAMDTIPYEVMTGLSRRMHRIYVED